LYLASIRARIGYLIDFSAAIEMRVDTAALLIASFLMDVHIETEQYSGAWQ